jgi:hypothetical protein
VKEEGDDILENSLWQSFEHPTDTLLPEMKQGWNKITGMDWSLTSWKSPDDPARGHFIDMLSPNGYPEILVIEDSKVKYRSGPWNGLRFSGSNQLKQNPRYTFEFVYNENETFYRYHLVNNSMLWRLVISPEGDLQRFTWIDQTQSWLLFSTANTDNCERYALCGANGICSIHNSPMCDCLHGFVPKIRSDWEATDWSSGCVEELQ